MTTNVPLTSLAAHPPGRPLSANRRRLGRAATVVGAAVVTTAVFLAARAAGADFTITDPGEGKVPHTFVAAEIATVTVVFGLLGWLTLAALERWSRRAHRIWVTLALVVVLLSLVPIWIERATTETRLGLAVVHIVVGLALLPLLRFAPDTSAASAATSTSTSTSTSA
jgi:uncharacterized membrane protein